MFSLLPFGVRSTNVPTSSGDCRSGRKKRSIRERFRNRNSTPSPVTSVFAMAKNSRLGNAATISFLSMKPFGRLIVFYSHHSLESFASKVKKSSVCSCRIGIQNGSCGRKKDGKFFPFVWNECTKQGPDTGRHETSLLVDP